MNLRSPITTHVLDQVHGKAASGIHVTLEQGDASGANWKQLAHAKTNADGRIENWGTALPPGSKAEIGIYRLTFETEPYFKASGRETFYPSISVLFRLERPEQHHHVPLLLSPYGYSTYRGT